MDTGLRWRVLCGSLIGMILAITASWQTAQIAGGSISPFCRISAWLNCSIAHGSSYAWLLGIPIAWWGFLFYLWLFLMTLRLSASQQQSGFWQTAFILSLISLIISIFYAGSSVITLHVLCPICLLMYITNLFIFVQLIRQGPSFLQDALQLIRQIRYDEIIIIKKQSFLFMMASFMLYFAFGAGFYKAVTPESGFRIDIRKEINRFYQNPVYKFATPSSPILGDSLAIVKIHIISDFECPFCAKASFDLQQLVARYPFQVSLQFFNFPLDRRINPYVPDIIHKHASLAALAVKCAHQFGGYWTFHDSLFARSDSLTENVILAIAAAHGWSDSLFRQCLYSQEIKQKVVTEIEFAHSLKIRGTPTVFLNGRHLEYWSFSPLLEEVIQHEIAKRD